MHLKILCRQPLPSAECDHTRNHSRNATGWMWRSDTGIGNEWAYDQPKRERVAFRERIAESTLNLLHLIRHEVAAAQRKAQKQLLSFLYCKQHSLCDKLLNFPCNLGSHLERRSSIPPGMSTRTNSKTAGSRDLWQMPKIRWRCREWSRHMCDQASHVHETCLPNIAHRC